MVSKVYLVKTLSGKTDEDLSNEMNNTLIKSGHLRFVKKQGFIAIKTHFGEGEKSGFVRPVYIRELGALIKEYCAYPFLTETSTLYKGNRSNAVNHLCTTYKNGFSYDSVQMPIIMADGLWGEDGVDIPINGRIFKTVNIAPIITRCNGMIVILHFTGHMMTGFAGALKNMAMGYVSRRGKLAQHANSKPRFNVDECTKCGECCRWCPAAAIKETDSAVFFDEMRCLRCGQSETICPNEAVHFSWDHSRDGFQKRLVEHALGVYESKRGNIVFINFLTRVTKNCDCINAYRPMCPDIGILISNDPVAIDKASIDLIEQSTGSVFMDLRFKDSLHDQLEYAQTLNLGNICYELVTLP